MPNRPYCPTCCTFIPAVPCASQPKAGTPPPLVVPKALWSTLTGPRLFNFAGYCYTIDPANPQRKRNKGEARLANFGGKDYEDCAECVDDLTPAPGGGTPGGSPCCPAVGAQCCIEPHPVSGVCVHVDVVFQHKCAFDPTYVYYSGGDFNECMRLSRLSRRICYGTGGVPTNPPVPVKRGFKAELCPGYTGGPDVWVIKYEGQGPGGFPEQDSPGSGIYIFRYGPRCYVVEIGEGAGAVIPAGAIATTLGAIYQTCDECRGGLPGIYCGNQIMPPGTRWPYISASDLPAAPVIVRLESGCWRFDPAFSTVPIPQGAQIIAAPTTQYPDCGDCVVGVVHELCLRPDGSHQTNHRKAPKLWTPADYIPDDIDPVHKFQGWCYRLPRDGPKVKRPTDALLVFARDQFFGECDNCTCADPESINGIKATVCAGQIDAWRAVDLWVPLEDLPEESGSFTHSALCYFIDVDGQQRRMPAGAKLVAPTVLWPDCGGCIADRVDEPTPTPTPTTPTPTPTPAPTPTPECPPVGFPPPECTDPPDPPPPPDPTDPTDPGGPPFPPPAPTTQSYRLYTCNSETGVVMPTALWVAARDAGGNPNGIAGRYITIGGVCYWVSGVQRTDPGIPYDGPVYVRCEQCHDDLCDVCPSDGSNEVTTNWDNTNVVWFPGTHAAGDYTIQYVRGALGYGPDYFQVNDLAFSTHCYRIVREDPGTLAVSNIGIAPGVTGDTYHSQAEVEEASRCMTTVVTHPGGRIGIRLDDDPLDDNTLDTSDPDASAPVFRLCEGAGGGGPGPCPESVMDQDPIGIVFGWPEGCAEGLPTTATAVPGGDRVNDPSLWPLPDNAYGINFYPTSDLSGVSITCSPDGTKWIANVSESVVCVGIGFTFEKPRGAGEARPSPGAWTYVGESHECCAPGVPTMTTD